jgi:hypothetical protein
MSKAVIETATARTGKDDSGFGGLARSVSQQHF